MSVSSAEVENGVHVSLMSFFFEHKKTGFILFL